MRSKGAKLFVVLLALVTIGFLVLPSVVTLFAGQHFWYSLSESGNDVPCEKCHADIADEMKQIAGPHTGETGFGRFDCEYCHRVFPIEDQTSNFREYTYASGDNGAVPGNESHAASTVACMYCHSGGSYSDWGGYYKGYDSQTVYAHNTFDDDCTDCHDPLKLTNKSHSPRLENEDCWRCHKSDNSNQVYYVPPAGGFNLTLYPHDTGNQSAHKSFVINAITEKGMEDANEACIACHTSIAVKINWTHARSLEFDIGLQKPIVTSSGTHNWTVTKWDYNGTANITSWGNTTGSAKTTYWVGWPGEVPGVNYR